MKIESGYQKYQMARATAPIKPSQLSQTKTAEQKSVDLAFSQTAQNLQKSTKSLESSPVNTDKVAALKAAIKNGTYQVDADQLAKTMLNSDK